MTAIKGAYFKGNLSLSKQGYRTRLKHDERIALQFPSSASTVIVVGVWKCPDNGCGFSGDQCCEVNVCCCFFNSLLKVRDLVLWVACLCFNKATTQCSLKFSFFRFLLCNKGVYIHTARQQGRVLIVPATFV